MENWRRVSCALRRRGGVTHLTIGVQERRSLILLRLGLAEGCDVLATPRGLCQSAQGVDIQQGVEVGECDEHGNVHHVLGVATKVRDHADRLREEKPDEEQNPAQRLGVGRARSQNLRQEPGETDVDEQRRVLEHGEVDDVTTPGVLARAPVSLVAHDGEVATETSTGPSQALVNIPPVLLQCRLEEHGCLDGDLPALIRVDLGVT